MIRNIIDRLENEIAAAREQERQMVIAAVAEHGSLPPNYWQPRDMLERRLEAAIRVREALEDQDPSPGSRS